LLAEFDVSCDRRSASVKLLSAFAAIYFVWGSTYLAIFYAIESIPPFTMAGARFLLAGAILYAWSRARGHGRPSLGQWWSASVAGCLMFLCCNGSLVWAEQHVPSGLASLIIATTPLWLALLTRLPPGSKPLGGRKLFGLGIGIVGVGLIFGPVGLTAGGADSTMGAIVLIFGAISWAAGSLYSRSAKQQISRGLESGMAMITGGAALLAPALTSGEFSRLDLGGITIRSALALAYLIVFGSIISFTAYLWLLRNVNPVAVGTYAYVNPVIAMVLGSVLAGELLTPWSVIAAGVIIIGVFFISYSRDRESRSDEPVAGQQGRDFKSAIGISRYKKRESG